VIERGLLRSLIACLRVEGLLLRIYRPALTALICMSGVAHVHGEPPPETNALLGTWIEQPRSPPGHVASVIELTEKDRRLTGHRRVEGLSVADSELHNLTLLGNSFSFEDGGVEYRGRFVKSDEITFEHDPVEDPASHFTFRRASAADIAALKEQTPVSPFAHRIPLPAIHDVPSNGLALTPPMGWNSWNHFQTTIDDKSIREMADGMVSSGLRDAGYVYLVIDDGWQGRRDGEGKLHPNPKFPDMKALAAYVHSKGLKFGLYSSPGPLTCGSYLGSHGYEVEDANSFAQWDIDFLKYDMCYAYLLYTKQTEIRALFQKMGDALQATDRPIVYSVNYNVDGVTVPWGHKVGANLWRTSDDIADAWDVMASNGFQNHGDRRNVAPGAWNDLDMLEVGNGGMSLEEYRTHFTLWSMLAAPLFLGNDLHAMTPQIRDLLTNREVIAVDQDRLGKPGGRILRKNDVEIWTKPLADGKTAVALFNRGRQPAAVRMLWSELGLSGGRRVRDLWAHTDLQNVGSAYTITVVPHGSILLSVEGPHQGTLMSHFDRPQNINR
jgi:alpha-galactosidase